MIEISKDEFLASMTAYFLDDLGPDSIRAHLETVWEQASGQALVDQEKRRLQHTLGQAVMSNGGPREVAERIGVDETTIKRWVVDPLNMRLSEVRRLQMATGLSLELTVLHPVDGEE